MRSLTLFMFMAYCGVCAALPAGALGQTGGTSAGPRPDDAQVLRALLDEVRQLRMALQRATAGTYRVQLAFERARLQQGRVDALARELDGVRAQLGSTRFARTQLDERLKAAEEQLSQESVPLRRSQMERQLGEIKLNAAFQEQQEQRQREREGQLSAQLQTEQSKLTELNSRLEALERELDSP